LVSCMPSPFCYVCSFLLSILLFCKPGDNVFQHHRRRVCQAIFSADERDEFLFKACTLNPFVCSLEAAANAAAP
jgi:hypothetical protein